MGGSFYLVFAVVVVVVAVVADVAVAVSPWLLAPSCS